MCPKSQLKRCRLSSLISNQDPVHIFQSCVNLVVEATGSFWIVRNVLGRVSPSDTTTAYMTHTCVSHVSSQSLYISLFSNIRVFFWIWSGAGILDSDRTTGIRGRLCYPAPSYLQLLQSHLNYGVKLDYDTTALFVTECTPSRRGHCQCTYVCAK
jgi:hypothetical protein